MQKRSKIVDIGNRWDEVRLCLDSGEQIFLKKGVDDIVVSGDGANKLVFNKDTSNDNESTDSQDNVGCLLKENDDFKSTHVSVQIDGRTIHKPICDGFTSTEVEEDMENLKENGGHTMIDMTNEDEDVSNGASD